ncbi:hypothetical protein CRE_03618 [Caenorhabditis remanei]|uniref:Zinc finger PHD-type domain-containing protein n=1 Tax=Caenorhabditis remanei TaxID=31234 RepID=E3LXA1_CAERE|nr:hypothetical protein CRE_03618 [Caenorhabditis remanei]
MSTISNKTEELHNSEYNQTGCDEFGKQENVAKNIIPTPNFWLKKEIKEELEGVDETLPPRRKRATHILPPHLLKEIKHEVDDDLSEIGQCVADLRRNPELDPEYVMLRRQSEKSAERYLAAKEVWDRFVSFEDAKPVKRRRCAEVVASTELPKKRAKPVKKNWRDLEEEEYTSQMEKARKGEVRQSRNNEDSEKGVVIKKKEATKKQGQQAKNRECPSKLTHMKKEIQTASSHNSAAQKPKKEKEEARKYNCPICLKAARSGTCLCIGCGEWIHLKCAGIKMSQYDSEFRCRKCSH